MGQATIGVIGMAVMGANLAMNIADNGFRVAIHNRTSARIDAVVSEAGDLAANLVPCPELADFVDALERPRRVVIMVAAKAVDAVIAQVIPLLEAGDIVIDAGNANFHDTRRREADLKSKGFLFVGMGVSGGEEGARFGPSIMVGGDRVAFEPIRDLVEAIAARYDGQPCAAHVGPDGAGHFVKTVHNGIEYADMQMIAEVYGAVRGTRSPAEIGAMFTRWNEGALKSYLIEITGEVLKATDPETGHPMVDEIVDQAGQKGTGRWTIIEALTLGNSASTIEAAVAARSWSADRAARSLGQETLVAGDLTPTDFDDDMLENALFAAKIIAYSQGFSLLLAADKEYGWNLDLGQIAEVWREGCIIRSAMLNDMAKAARQGLPHGHLILSEDFATRLAGSIDALRGFVARAAMAGLPSPAMSAALSYFDTMRQARGTTNLVQGQRDFFGAHGFERFDGRRDQHGPWGL